MKENGLVDKSTTAGFINNTDLNEKIATLATKVELKSKQDKIKKLQKLGSNYFLRKSHFENENTQNYLVFQQFQRYFKTITNTSAVTIWKSKGYFDEHF